jgi:hypothetical protein
MSEIDRAECRRAAAECILLARTIGDPDTKEALLIRAQEWLKLAYSDHDAEFDRLLAAFNEQQMGLEEVAQQTPHLPMRPQAVQQQQSKAQPENE